MEDIPEEKEVDPGDEYDYHEPGWELEPGEKVFLCETHPELTQIIATRWDSAHDSLYLHCGNCCYCILADTLLTYAEKCKERGSWREELYSWKGVVGEANSGVIQLGYHDFNRGVPFLDTIDDTKDTTDDILYFRKLYEFGYEYAKKGYDFETLKILTD